MNVLRRAAAFLFLAGLAMAASPAEAQHPTITVHVGDTLGMRFSIRTDTILQAIGKNNVLAAKCGTGVQFFSDSSKGKALHRDTVNVVVTGCTAPTPAPVPTPAPTPTPIPTPIGASEPVYSSATGTLVAADSIDGYTSAHAMWTSTASGPRFVQAQNSTEDPDSTLLMSGGHANPNGKYLRLVYGIAAPNTQQARAWYFVGVPTQPITTTHYFSYWARVTFSTPLNAQPNQQAVALKWFMAYHPNVGDRIQWNTHDNEPCNQNDWAHTNNYWQVYDAGTLTRCQGNQPIGPGLYPGDIFNGQWHRFTYQYRANSAAGSRDGFARMWVDGTKIIDISQGTVGVTPPGGYKTWCDQSDVDALVTDVISTLDFGSVLTSSPPTFTLDIDDFIWWTGK